MGTEERSEGAQELIKIPINHLSSQVILMPGLPRFLPEPKPLPFARGSEGNGREGGPEGERTNQ
jgi:hypothetical protein